MGVYNLGIKLECHFSRFPLIQQEAAETASNSVGSALAEFLDCSWAWGDLSPQQVQVIAAKVLSDM